MSVHACVRKWESDACVRDRVQVGIGYERGRIGFVHGNGVHVVGREVPV